MQEDVESPQQVLVIAKAGGRWVRYAGGLAPCAIGRSGTIAAESKREGDGATPAGNWPLRRLFWRPDRGERPLTHLETVEISADMGWCDDPGSPDYNRLVTLPCPSGHEQMWRDDQLYDLVIELGYNDDPVRPGRGSAIFVHLAHADYRPTEGCIAVDRETFLDLARRAKPGDTLSIEP